MPSTEDASSVDSSLAKGYGKGFFALLIPVSGLIFVFLLLLLLIIIYVPDNVDTVSYTHLPLPTKA